MKKDVHPEYHLNTKITCACGHTFAIGATKEKMEVEVCSNCHPFYTGSQDLIDTAGRAEKFKARQEKASQTKTRRKSEKRTVKKIKKNTAKTTAPK